jgi:mannose-6-phosphate isomerase-like protein (cupin superfamily)
MHVNINEVTAKEISPGTMERVLLRPEQTTNKGASIKHYILQRGSRVVFDEPLTEFQHFVIQGVIAEGGPNGDLVHANSAIFVPCTNRFLKEGATPNARQIFNQSGEGETRLLTVSYKIPRPNFRWAKSRTKNLYQVPQYHSSRQMVGYTQIFTEEEHALMGALRINGVSIQTHQPRYAMREHQNPEEVTYILRGEGEVICDGEKHKVRAGSLVYIPEGDAHSIHNTHQNLPLQYLVLEFIEHEKMWAERSLQI